jgi:hypothetical protein
MFLRKKKYRELIGRLERLEKIVMEQDDMKAPAEKEEEGKSKKNFDQIKRSWMLFADERGGKPA